MDNIELKKECLGNLRGTPQHKSNGNLNNNTVTMKDVKSNKENQGTLTNLQNQLRGFNNLKSINEHKYFTDKNIDLKLHHNLKLYNEGIQKVAVQPLHSFNIDGKVELKSAVRYYEENEPRTKNWYGLSPTSAFGIVGCKDTELLETIFKQGHVYIAEGISTADAIAKSTDIVTLNCTSKNNMEAVIKNIRSVDVKEKIKITILADLDAISLAEAIAKEHNNIFIATPNFTEEEKEKFKKNFPDKKISDFWDLWKVGGNERVKKCLEAAKLIERKPVLPARFKYKDGGLYYQKNDDDTKDIFISSIINIVAQTSDDKSKNWGRLVEFEDKNNITHREVISMDTLGADCSAVISVLLNNGMSINHVEHTAKKRLIQFIQDTKVYKSTTCVNKVGWYKNHFILPHCIIPSTNAIYWQNNKLSDSGYSKKGTLEEWQKNVARYCEGNSRLILALSIAFTAPLLPILGSESYGINLIGSSSTGKSTALKVASSVYGGHNYIQQWRATDNALESVAEAHNHTLLCLDELGQINGQKAGEIAYLLANGQGKNRLNKDSVTKKKYSWETIFLSTGEISISDKMKEYNKQSMAGMEVRCIDFPASTEVGYGIYEKLHNFDDGAKFSSYLQDVTNKYYGIAIIEFIERLVTTDNWENNIKDIRSKIQNDFFNEYIDDGADGQVKRVANHFINLISIAVVASNLGVLPFEEKNIIDSLIKCFNDWLEYRGTTKSSEEEKILGQVQGFFETHHKSRFIALNNANEEINPDEKIIKTLGYKKKINGGYEFYLYEGAYKEMISGFNKKTARDILLKEQILMESSLQKTFLNKRNRFYHFKLKVEIK